MQAYQQKLVNPEVGRAIVSGVVEMEITKRNKFFVIDLIPCN